MESDETKLALLDQQVSRQEEELREIRSHVEALEQRAIERDKKRAEQEKKQLMAGISLLGAIVLSMFGLIWSYRHIILRGGQ